MIVTQTAPAKVVQDVGNLESDMFHYYPDKKLPQAFIKKTKVPGELLFYFFKSKIAMKVRDVHRPYGDYINWNIFVPRDYKGRTRGLLGLLDGNPNNDIRLRDDTILNSQNIVSIRMGSDIHNQLSASCKFIHNEITTCSAKPSASVYTCMPVYVLGRLNRATE